MSEHFHTPCAVYSQHVVTMNLYQLAMNVAAFEALRYKSEGRGIDSRWCHWNFSFT
jgi:hypothetical protein